jgi:predicted transcriptional regulator of viral defense system
MTGPADESLRDALVIGGLLAPEGGVAYLAAMRHWGWTDADVDPIALITPRRAVAMRPELLGVRYALILTKPARVFGFVRESRDGLALRVTERERTVVDMLDRSDLCGGMAVVVEALRHAWPELDRERLTRRLERFGGGTVPKRLGFLAEALGLEPRGGEWTERWRALIAPGYSVLERGGPDRGRYTRRWMVRVNAEGFVPDAE